MSVSLGSSTQACTDNAEVIKHNLVRWLLVGGLGFQKTSDAIGNEVLFSRTWRRADLLLLSDEFHAIEIKSDADSLSRLTEQLPDYHRVFDKVSVATTRKQLRGIQRATAKKTGIILLEGDQPTVIRQAKTTKRLDKLELSRFLDKPTLVRMLGARVREMSVDELRYRVAKRFGSTEIRRVAYDALRQRYAKLFELFLRDIGDRDFGEDELRGLCGNVEAITL